MSTAQRQDIDLGMVRFEYGEAARARRAVLQIETSKYYAGGLISDASVYWVGDHSRQQMLSMGRDDDHGDYGKRLLVDRGKTATQRNIDKQHASVFTAEVVTGLVVAAKAHYARVIREGKYGFGNTYPAVEAVR